MLGTSRAKLKPIAPGPGRGRIGQADAGGLVPEATLRLDLLKESDIIASASLPGPVGLHSGALQL